MNVGRLRRGALGLAAGLTLVACGSSGPNAVNVLSAAPDKTTGAGSARFTIAVKTAVLGRTVDFSGSGLFNFVGHSGQLAFALPAALGGQRINEVLTSDVLYLQAPSFTPPGKYAAIKLSELTGGQSTLSQLGNSDPTTALDALRGVSKDTHKVGTGSVRDVSTTHYRGVLDIAKALPKVPAAFRERFRAVFGQVKTLPFDAYIDAQGRLRRLVEHVTVPASAQTGNQPVTADSTFDLYDFGVPVHVTAPPPGKTVDGSRLLQRLLGKG